MKLNQNYTKPSIRSILSFTDEELIDALKEYAKQRGYGFAEGSKYVVLHPDLVPCFDNDKLTKLIADIEGHDVAILGEHVK